MLPAINRIINKKKKKKLTRIILFLWISIHENKSQIYNKSRNPINLKAFLPTTMQTLSYLHIRDEIRV